MTNIILCGGSGTRLWPVSRPDLPKQFCRFFDDRSLFQATVTRNRDLSDRTLIVTNAVQAAIAATQLAELGESGRCSFILEPVGRNTAPALALACLSLDPEEPVVITPSDHVIRDEEAYAAAVRLALEAAADGSLVTFGLRPEYPETGYGYIESAEAQDGKPGLPVAAFREKPDRATAERYCSESRFYWNSGMFCFRAGAYLDELALHAPDLLATARVAFDRAARGGPGASAAAGAAAGADLGAPALAPSLADMEAIPSISIDYAVMEKSRRVRVVPCSIGWSDLGSFDTLYDIASKDGDANALQGDCLPIDSRRNLVLSDGRPVVLVGVEDCIVVDRPEALLVVARGRGQDVKKAAEAMAARRKEQGL